jgi:hypothetical protein
LEIQTPHTSSGPDDDIYDSFFWKFIATLHLDRTVDRANDRIAIL